MTAETSQALPTSDPRDRYDDPLLDSLLSLCALHQKSVSRAMLTAGLPLPEQRLTAELLPRAAARGGLQGRWLRRATSWRAPLASSPGMTASSTGAGAVLRLTGVALGSTVA